MKGGLLSHGTYDPIAKVTYTSALILGNWHNFFLLLLFLPTTTLEHPYYSQVGKPFSPLQSESIEWGRGKPSISLTRGVYAHSFLN